MSHAEIIASLLDVERYFLRKLSEDFGWRPEDWECVEIARGLYRFKALLQHYLDLYKKSSGRNLEERRRFFSIERYLNDNTLRNYSNGQFFGRIRFMLHFCKKMEQTRKQQATYLRWLLYFPIIPTSSFDQVLEHEIYPSNMPDTFIRMIAGLVRVELERGRKPKELVRIHRAFLKERNVSKAHSLWFRSRYPGSACSRH